MIDRLLRNFDTAKHPREFLDAFFFAQDNHSGSGCLAIGDLAYSKMLAGEAGNLRQVSDAQNLAFRAKLLQPAPNHFRNTPANPAVDLIKHHRRNLTTIACDDLDRKAHPR